MHDDRGLTPATTPTVGSAASDCACATPVPVQKAERKGVARTQCARCGLPIPLRFTPPPRGWL